MHLGLGLSGCRGTCAELFSPHAHSQVRVLPFCRARSFAAPGLGAHGAGDFLYPARSGHGFSELGTASCCVLGSSQGHPHHLSAPPHRPVPCTGRACRPRVAAPPIRLSTRSTEALRSAPGSLGSPGLRGLCLFSPMLENRPRLRLVLPPGISVLTGRQAGVSLELRLHGFYDWKGRIIGGTKHLNLSLRLLKFIVGPEKRISNDLCRHC